MEAPKRGSEWGSTAARQPEQGVRKRLRAATGDCADRPKINLCDNYSLVCDLRAPLCPALPFPPSPPCALRLLPASPFMWLLIPRLQRFLFYFVIILFGNIFSGALASSRPQQDSLSIHDPPSLEPRETAPECVIWPSI